MAIEKTYRVNHQNESTERKQAELSGQSFWKTQQQNTDQTLQQQSIKANIRQFHLNLFIGCIDDSNTVNSPKYHFYPKIVSPNATKPIIILRR